MNLFGQITLPTTGAACIFTGMVRGVTQRGDPHETVWLEYEAYMPMAEAKMAQVAEEIREQLANRGRDRHRPAHRPVGRWHPHSADRLHRGPPRHRRI